MKLIKALLTIISIFLAGCGNNIDTQNQGAQSSQDMPSNRDRDIEAARDDSIILKEGNTGTRSDSLSEAPNNGAVNPHQGIQGQTGTNQTGTWDTTGN
jgi:hypothetical protein